MSIEMSQMQNMIEKKMKSFNRDASANSQIIFCRLKEYIDYLQDSLGCLKQDYYAIAPDQQNQLNATE